MSEVICIVRIVYIYFVSPPGAEAEAGRPDHLPPTAHQLPAAGLEEQGQHGTRAAGVHQHRQLGDLQGPRGRHLRHGHRLHAAQTGVSGVHWGQVGIGMGRAWWLYRL